MDIYLDGDKKKVVAVFTRIKDDLSKVCTENATKEQVSDALFKAIHDLKHLDFALKHMDGFDPDKDYCNNDAGLSVVKSNIKRLCEDIAQSMEDTSWIEGIDTYAENQRAAVNEMIKAITDSNLTGAAKASAEQDLEMMQRLVPPEGAADWVVRGMRNEMLLAGIKSHIHSTLISVAEI